MKLHRNLVALGLGLGLTACASVETPSRNAPYESLPETGVVAPASHADTASATAGAATAMPAVLARGVTVGKVTVRVPRELKVSEANLFLPHGDIVWRGDPPGDRRAQVQAIVEAGLQKGVADLHGPVRVDLDVELVRFHSLSEKARRWTGGVHAVEFNLAIRDPETGALLAPVKLVSADLEGYGGRKAIEAEARGETMKLRITNHLATVIAEELTLPGGHRNAELGLIQRLNKI